MYLIKKSNLYNRNEVPTLSSYEQDLIRYSRSLSWQQEKDLFKDAFAIPIYSETIFMPLESNYERQVLNIILEVIQASLDKQKIKLEKPLFCYKTPDKQKYRPDFVIYGSKEQSIFVEVLGSHHEDYLTQKHQLNDIARPYCTYRLSVNAYDKNTRQKEYDQFKQQLTLYLEMIV